ncbi:hypothetical protein Tco_0873591 [Tanacetum coccineum]|uniref:Uncharacterized protein n=1 Tax=Tanacetum coccineum TaxID=301880 RepID=A0ABQ5BJB3_9ASTR
MSFSLRWDYHYEYGSALLKHGENGTKIVDYRFYGLTGESELNGSNLVQETNNKIVVIQERLEAAKLSKELACKSFVGDPKRLSELTWESKDQASSKCPQLFVDSANA